jgi:hypothetical protein
MQSKCYYAFKQKLSYFDDDIELVDAIRTSVISEDLTDPEGSYVIRRVDPARHSHLARRQNSAGSRRNAINHLRGTVYSSYIKDIYEEVTHYLRSVLEQASLNRFDSGRIVGEHTFKIDAKKILELGSWENVCMFVTDSIFQSLESERSTLKLVDKIAKKLGLAISQQAIDDAVPYLEIRHFLVHSDGRLPPEFLQKNSNIRHKNGVVDLDYRLISDLRSKVTSLMGEFDAQVVTANLLRPEDLRS